MTLLRRLLLGCWSGHSYLRDRTAKGVYVFRCEQCGHERPVLKGQVFRERKVGKVLKANFKRKVG